MARKTKTIDRPKAFENFDDDCSLRWDNVNEALTDYLDVSAQASDLQFHRGELVLSVVDGYGRTHSIPVRCDQEYSYGLDLGRG